MSWQTKMIELARLVTERPELGAMFEAWSPASTEFIENLKKVRPWIPEAYLDFLRISDGAQFDMFVLAGSPSCPMKSLSSLEAIWARDVPPDCLVFGEEAAGDAFCLEKDGRVTLRSIEKPDEPLAVANSFSEAVDQVFLGPMYPRVFPGGVSEDNEWYALLKEQGWA